MKTLLCALGLHSYDGWETFEKNFTVYLRLYAFGPLDLDHPKTEVETWQRGRCVRCGKAREEQVS